MLISVLIQFLRKAFDASGEQWDNYEGQIFRVCQFPSEAWKRWNFIIDSLYLLEDVQLAKANFGRFNLSGPTKYNDIGEQYLRLYGIYNACYLEKQAAFKIEKVLGLQINSGTINRLQIFEFRKCFGSHTVNVGHDELEHSYILDRSSLSNGTIEGYSSNAKCGHHSMRGDIAAQIDEWNRVLEEQLFMICQFILGRLQDVIGEKASKFETAISRIGKIRSGEYASFGGDIWAESFRGIEITTS